MDCCIVLDDNGYATATKQEVSLPERLEALTIGVEVGLEGLQQLSAVIVLADLKQQNA